MNHHPDSHPGFREVRLIQLADIDNHRFIDPLAGWDLTDVRAMALDPDVQMRRLAALSQWNWDIRLQHVLGSDPDQSVVLNLLSRVDPSIEVTRIILQGPHLEARRRLAARNLITELLLEALDDTDEQVRASARATLERRNVVVPEVAA